jgi:hypothetical protein
VLPYEEEMKEMEILHAKLQKVRERAESIRRACNHDWGPVEYTPEHVPAGVLPKWSRRCRKCGYVDVTTDARTVSHQEPDFGDK